MVYMAVSKSLAIFREQQGRIHIEENVSFN